MSPLASFRPIRHLLLAMLVVPAGVASGSGPASENIIPNGDFSQGNVGFVSDIQYIKPGYNCLWEGRYTLAPAFNEPLLHKLIAPEQFQAPIKRNGKEKVFFANAGGTEPMTIWATTVKVKPKTQYLITFNCISLSGHVEDGYPPHQVATEEWLPDFVIWANDQSSTSFQPGLGKYYKARMIWNSAKATTATIKIVRDRIPHGGGLIGISNIEMVPYQPSAKTAGSSQ